MFPQEQPGAEAEFALRRVFDQHGANWSSFRYTPTFPECCCASARASYFVPVAPHTQACRQFYFSGGTRWLDPSNSCACADSYLHYLRTCVPL